MAVPVMTRSQRRMEKKQALVLLALVLAVALVSFTLGVMVGKGSPPPPSADPPPARIPVAPVSPEKTESSPSAPPLTFYDTLPRGEQTPLGSGINLPPAEQAPAGAEPAKASPAAAATEPSRPAASPPAPPPAIKSQAEPVGAWSIQAASFREAGDARSLQARLGKKGFEAALQAVDLGGKGKWHRVIVGPFRSREAAERAAVRLQTEEHLSVLVRRD